MPKKKMYLGIDQTGAVDSKGVPRPLPVCLMTGNRIYFFYIFTFSKAEIKKVASLKKDERMLICLDCVLGLPSSIKLDWRGALKLAKKSHGYGRATAAEFFRKIGKGDCPSREIELACNANSVFKELPFQRNIQTGSFRLWKDIALNDSDFYVPAIEERKAAGQIPVCEGYPSLSWKMLFNSNFRTPSQLAVLTKKHWPKLVWTRMHQLTVNKDPNFADAFVLALTMKVFYKDALKIRPQKEGWILGF